MSLDHFQGQAFIHCSPERNFVENSDVDAWIEICSAFATAHDCLSQHMGTIGPSIGGDFHSIDDGIEAANICFRADRIQYSDQVLS